MGSAWIKERHLGERTILLCWLTLGGNLLASDANESFRDPLREGSFGPEMVAVPPGTFEMGDHEGVGFADEYPLHRVVIAYPFALGKYEVTIGEYRRFVSSTGRSVSDKYNKQENDFPVSRVSWHDAIAYTSWLSDQTGKHYRLPSEAEWEYAARAGQSDAIPGNFRLYACVVPIGEGCPDSSAKVGSFYANAFGLHDMAGNVDEWVMDCYHDNYVDAPRDGRPRLECDYNIGVVRGGSWGNQADRVRPGARNDFSFKEKHPGMGFRVARDLHEHGQSRNINSHPGER